MRIYKTKPLIERLTFVETPNSCWEFTGCLNRGGYGKVRDKYRSLMAHRAAAHVWLGFDLDVKKVVMHTCDNRKCINPAHLQIGTALENVRDCFRKGRHPYAPQNKTHCIHGHEYTENNTYVNRTDGSRGCRTCHGSKYLRHYRISCVSKIGSYRAHRWNRDGVCQRCSLPFSGYRSKPNSPRKIRNGAEAKTCP